MAYENFSYNGQTVRINVSEVNKNNAIEEINNEFQKIAKAKEAINEFKGFLKEQQEEIPEHPTYGEKDELGENVETYLDELMEKVDKEMYTKLEKIEMRKEEISTKAGAAAYQIDKEKALNNYKINNPITPESKQTSSKIANTSDTSTDKKGTRPVWII